jgi:hypothetical protein
MDILKISIMTTKGEMLFSPYRQITAFELSEIMAFLLNVHAGNPSSEMVEKWFFGLSAEARHQFKFIGGEKE